MSPALPPSRHGGSLFTWWGWKTGAFFGDVLIPGLIAMGIAAAAVIAFGRPPASSCAARP